MLGMCLPGMALAPLPSSSRDIQTQDLQSLIICARPVFLNRRVAKHFGLRNAVLDHNLCRYRNIFSAVSKSKIETSDEQQFFCKSRTMFDIILKPVKTE